MDRWCFDSHEQDGRTEGVYVEIPDTQLPAAGQCQAMWDQLIWPYPEEQIQWMVRSYGHLSQTTLSLVNREVERYVIHFHV
jgi:hypothetical protein